MDATKIRLNVILLNYKTPDLSIACLRSMASQITNNIKVIIVDNASGDGSAERIRKEIKNNHWQNWASVIESKSNGGFAAGNNLGIRSSRADAYILLNSDTIVRDGLFTELAKAMHANPNAGLISPAMFDEQGNASDSAFRNISPISELLRGASLGVLDRIMPNHTLPWPKEINSNASSFPDWVGFACVLIRHDVLEMVGYLDEGFFMYYEDVDYCRRVRAHGWEIMRWPSAQIVHFLGGSSGMSSKHDQKKRAPLYYYLSRSRYFIRYYGRTGLLAANLCWTLGMFLGGLRNTLMRRKSNHRTGEFLGNWSGFLQSNSLVRQICSSN